MEIYYERNLVANGIGLVLKIEEDVEQIYLFDIV